MNQLPCPESKIIESTANIAKTIHTIQSEPVAKSAKKNFVTENEKSDKPYQLSASMGYAITNLSNETIDDFMNRIDEQMYQDKMKYYEHNDRRNSK